MRRAKVAIFSLLLVLSLVASVAFAGNVKFKFVSVESGTSSTATTFTLAATTNDVPDVIASVELVGLGLPDVHVHLNVWATGTAICQNNGGNFAPGQNPVTVALEGTQFVTALQNGTASTTVVIQTADLTQAQMPTSEQAGCPNAKNWKVTSIENASYTRAAVSVTNTSDTEELVEPFQCSFQGGVCVPS